MYIYIYMHAYIYILLELNYINKKIRDDIYLIFLIICDLELLS